MPKRIDADNGGLFFTDVLPEPGLPEALPEAEALRPREIGYVFAGVILLEQIITRCTPGGGKLSEPTRTVIATATEEAKPTPTLTAELSADQPVLSLLEAPFNQYLKENPTIPEVANLQRMYWKFQESNELFTGVDISDARLAAIAIYDAKTGEKFLCLFAIDQRTNPSHPFEWYVGSVSLQPGQETSKFTLINEVTFGKSDHSVWAGDTQLTGEDDDGKYVLTPNGNKVYYSSDQTITGSLKDAALSPLIPGADKIIYDFKLGEYQIINADGNPIGAWDSTGNINTIATPDKMVINGRELTPAADGTVFDPESGKVYEFNKDSLTWEESRVESIADIIAHIPESDQRLIELLNLHQFDDMSLTTELASVDGQLTQVYLANGRRVGYYDPKIGFASYANLDWNGSLLKNSDYFDQAKLRDILTGYQPATVNGIPIPLGHFEQQVFFDYQGQPKQFPTHDQQTTITSFILVPGGYETDYAFDYGPDTGLFSAIGLLVQPDGQILAFDVEFHGLSDMAGWRVTTPRLTGFDPATGRFTLDQTSLTSASAYRAILDGTDSFQLVAFTETPFKKNVDPTKLRKPTWAPITWPQFLDPDYPLQQATPSDPTFGSITMGIHTIGLTDQLPK